MKHWITKDQRDVDNGEPLIYRSATQEEALRWAMNWIISDERYLDDSVDEHKGLLMLTLISNGNYVAAYKMHRKLGGSILVTQVNPTSKSAAPTMVKLKSQAARAIKGLLVEIGKSKVA